MRIVNWNIERRSPSTWQAKSLLGEIAQLDPDVVCLTEAWETSADQLGGHSVSTTGAAWSNKDDHERKVLLWSKNVWRDVQVIEELEATGSAITGRTELAGTDVRVVGLCIPYSFASPRGQKPRARKWSLHERFLQDLAPLLRQWRNVGPVIVTGDFNRFIPRYKGSKQAYALLEAALDGYEVITAGEIVGVNKPTIDHIAFAGDLIATQVTGRPAEADDGRRRSDHFGVVADFEFRFAEA